MKHPVIFLVALCIFDMMQAVDKTHSSIKPRVPCILNNREQDTLKLQRKALDVAITQTQNLIQQINVGNDATIKGDMEAELQVMVHRRTAINFTLSGNIDENGRRIVLNTFVYNSPPRNKRKGSPLGSTRFKLRRKNGDNRMRF